MFRKICSMMISLGLITTQFAVMPVSAQQTETMPTTDEYYTDRFILEVKSDNISMFSMEETTVSEEDIASAVSDVLSDLGNDAAKEDVEVSAISDTDNVLVLPEEVNVDEFVQAVTETFGADVTIQPDYPVYMDAAQSVNALSASSDGNDTLREWEQNLASAQELSTGEGARIAVLGAWFNDTYYLRDVLIDEYRIVNNYTSYSNNKTEDMAKCAVIHEVAPDAKIIPITVFRESEEYGSGRKAYTSDIVKAIQYAQNKGAQVFVCDWYTNEYNAYLEKCMQDSTMLFIASGGCMRYNIYYEIPPGNGNISERYQHQHPVYPADFDMDNLITVSCVRDNYNLFSDFEHSEYVDLYAWGQDIKTGTPANSSTYTSYGTRGANALVAGAAALVIGKNNSAQNLKDILLQSATAVEYLPGTKDYVSYKVLDFNNAVKGVESEKKINIDTPRENDPNIYYGHGESMYTPVSIYYSDIKQIATGGMGINRNATAVLMGDGTVKMRVDSDHIPPSPLHPFDTEAPFGLFKTVTGLNNIVQIAFTPNGNSFAAVDEDGDLYEWGYKRDLGIAESGIIPLPTKDTDISNVESVYLLNNTMWVQLKADQDGNKKVYSIGEHIYRDGESYEFGEVAEAENATQICLTESDAMIIKDNTVYLKSPDSFTIEQAIAAPSPGHVLEGFIFDKQYYALDDTGVLWNFSNAAASEPYMIDYNISQITANDSYIMAKKSNAFGEYSLIKPGEHLLSDSVKLDTDAKIKDNICFNEYPPYPYHNFLEGYCILTEDGNLYHALPYRPSGYYHPSEYYKAAQRDFAENSVHSIVPMTFEMEYDQEFTEAELEFIKFMSPYDKVTVTLSDGIDIKVPVEWNIETFDSEVLGKQIIEGEVTLPPTITNAENLKATLEIIVKARVVEVENFKRFLDYNDTIDLLTPPLPNEVGVTLSNTQKAIFPVTWNLSGYNPQQAGEQKFYGILTLDAMASNPHNLQPVLTIVNSLLLTEDGIEQFEEIYVKPKTDISDIALPQQVKLTLPDGSERSVDVGWDTASFDPDLAGEQTIVGDLVLPEDIRNPQGLSAKFTIIVESDAKYDIASIEPVYLTADRCVPFDQIPGVPDKVTVTTKSGATDVLSVKWDDTYEPEREMNDNPQLILGEVDTTGKDITNYDNVPASLYIDRNDVDYVVTELSPASAEVTVDLGTALEDLLHCDAMPQTVTVTMQKAGDEDVTLSLEKELEILPQDNTAYDPQTPGVYTIAARPVFVADNISIAAEKYFTLKVTVKEKQNVKKIQPAHISTYLYTSASALTWQEQVQVFLDDDSVAWIDVTWNKEKYKPETLGYQIINGTFENVPVNINIDAKFKPILTIYVAAADYEVTQVMSGGYEMLPAGLTLDEVFERLSEKEVEIEIRAVNIAADKPYILRLSVPFTLDAENSEYQYDQIGMHTLRANLTLPERVTNPENLPHEIMVYLTLVDIDPETKTVYNDIVVSDTTPIEEYGLPTELPVKLTNGKEIFVPVTWVKDTMQDEEGKVKFTGEGQCPSYVSEPTVTFHHIVTVKEDLEAYIIAIINENFPTDGSTLRIPLGTPLSDIPDFLTEEVQVITFNGVDTEFATVGIEILEKNNPEYSLTEPGTYALTADLLLPEYLTNPDDITVTVNVETYQKTIREIKPISMFGIAAGTPFDEINASQTVHVKFTDGTEEDIAVTWDEQQYDPNPAKTKNELITGTLNLPAHVINPNKLPVYLVVQVVVPTTAQLLSLTPNNEISLFSLRSQSVSDGFIHRLSDNLIEYKYIAEYLNEDGSITTEEFSVYEILED